MKTYTNKIFRFCIATIPLLFTFLISFSQGKYTQSFKHQIGKTFTNEKNIPWLKGYTFREGTMITDIGDGEPQFLTVLMKGSKGVVIYSASSDTVTSIRQVIDIIEVKNIPPGWEIRTIGCQEGDTKDQIIIALVNPGKDEIVKTVKQAWLCERDRLKIEAISTKNIKCLNEGQD